MVDQLRGQSKERRKANRDGKNGLCPACQKVYATQKIVIAELTSPGITGDRDRLVSMWNKTLEDNPCQLNLNQ